MNFDKLVETKIQEAMERGDFDDLKGKGLPLDMGAYFDTPEELRAAYTIMKQAGMLAPEIELMREISALKERIASAFDPLSKGRAQKLLRDKQLQLSIMMEKKRARRRES